MAAKNVAPAFTAVESSLRSLSFDRCRPSSVDDVSQVRCDRFQMPPVKAQVKNGRRTVDEPTDLPEGQVVHLGPVEGIVPELDEQRDDGDRVALHAELEASIAESESGQIEDFAKMIGELRRRP